MATVRLVIRSCAAVLALLALLTLTGCGARVTPGYVSVNEVSATDAARAGTQDDGAADPSAMPHATTDAAETTGTTSGQSTTEPTPSKSPDFGPKHNNGAVKIELSATCVHPGDLLVITMRVPPKAGLGMIIGYSDNQPHGAMLTGESDANGVYVWRVPVDPTVPEGQARVLVTATGPNWEQEGGGTGDAVFQVTRGAC